MFSNENNFFFFTSVRAVLMALKTPNQNQFPLKGANLSHFGDPCVSQLSVNHIIVSAEKVYREVE